MTNRTPAKTPQSPEMNARIKAIRAERVAVREAAEIAAMHELFSPKNVAAMDAFATSSSSFVPGEREAMDRGDYAEARRLGEAQAAR